MSCNIDEIRARAEAATPGPWGTPENPIIPLLEIPYNVGFIAHAREDISTLLDALEAKERDLAAAVSDLNFAGDCDTCEMRGKKGFSNCRPLLSDDGKTCANYNWRGAGKERNDVQKNRRH